MRLVQLRLDPWSYCLRYDTSQSLEYDAIMYRKLVTELEVGMDGCWEFPLCVREPVDNRFLERLKGLITGCLLLQFFELMFWHWKEVCGMDVLHFYFGC